MKGGFRLTQWTASSTELLARLKQGSSNTIHDFEVDPQATPKTLGLLWDRVNDQFFFRTNPETTSTKRGILSIITKIFDPLGFLSPILLTAKIIQQDLWKAELGWDDIAPADILKRWNSWVNALPTVERLRIPRCLKPLPCSDVQIHTFSDASQVGYCAGVYLGVVRLDGSVDVRLVMSKGRVAPIKMQTIPKLELESCVVGLRLTKFVVESLGMAVSEVAFWTDSTTALAWINSRNCKFPVFVANRVGEILEGSRRDQWRHVPGRLNPVDCGTRGLAVEELNNGHS